jgi:hypothetical protein
MGPKGGLDTVVAKRKISTILENQTPPSKAGPKWKFNKHLT